ncbi:hypothetical protein C8Q74DRAFT_887794 [Fomes fomentarius]|nr:hypothetical protein C8Q74DRAFT_887794 [Fomes fomentarius]
MISPVRTTALVAILVALAAKLTVPDCSADASLSSLVRRPPITPATRTTSVCRLKLPRPWHQRHHLLFDHTSNAREVNEVLFNYDSCAEWMLHIFDNVTALYQSDWHCALDQAPCTYGSRHSGGWTSNLISPSLVLAAGGRREHWGPPGTLCGTFQRGHTESPCRSVGALSESCGGATNGFSWRGPVSIWRDERGVVSYRRERVSGPVATQRRPCARAWRWVVQRSSHRAALMEITGRGLGMARVWHWRTWLS